MQIFAPDTNFFLQCHPADKIAWKQVTQASDVVLLVVREVRKELDRLKSGGNQRRAKRARSASMLLRRLTTEGLQELELRASDPRVTVRIAPRPVASALPADYLIETSDDRIVAEVFAAQGAAQDPVTFLSHDSVPFEDATGLGVPTQVVPESWLLDPEPSELERELGDMKRRMKLLEGRVPEMIVSVPVDADGVLRLKAPYFPPLSKTFIDSVMREVRKKRPISAPPDEHLPPALRSQSSGARWIRYENEHAEWLTKVERALEDAWTYFSDDPRAMRLEISLSNQGHAGADNLIVRIEPRGSIHFVDDDALDEEQGPPWYFPWPPKTPGPRELSGLPSLDYLTQDLSLRSRSYLPNIPTSAMARDRHAVYWEYEGGRHASRLEGQCADFRHGLQPDVLDLLIERDEFGDEPIRGAIEVLVSAGNLPEPTRNVYPVMIEAVVHDLEALIRDLLKRQFQIDV